VLIPREPLARERLDAIAADLGLTRSADPPWTDGVRYTTWEDQNGRLTFAAHAPSGLCLMRVESESLADHLDAQIPSDGPEEIVAQAERAGTSLEVLRGVFRVRALALINGLDLRRATAWLCAQLENAEPLVRWAAARALENNLDAEVERAFAAAAGRYLDLGPDNEVKRRVCEAQRDGTLEDGPTDKWWVLAERAREGVAKGQWRRVVKATEDLLGKTIDHAEGLFLRALAFEAGGEPVLALGLAAAARARTKLTVEAAGEEPEENDLKLLAEIDQAMPRLEKAANAQSPEDRDRATASLTRWIERWGKDHSTCFAGAADALARRIPSLEAGLLVLGGSYRGDAPRLEEACLLAPDSPTAHHELARAWAKDSARSAIEAERRALELARSKTPRSPEARTIERLARAAGIRVTEKRALKELAQLVYKSQQWAEAASLAEELTSVDPGALSGWQMRANALTFALRHEEAVVAFDEALEQMEEHLEGDDGILFGEDPRAQMHFNRSCVLAKLARRDEALESLRRAVRIEEKYAAQAVQDDYWQAFWSDPELKAIAALQARALTLPEERDPAFVRKVVDRALGLSFRGEVEQAIEAADQAARLAEGIDRWDMVVEALSIAGRTIAFSGNPEAGLDRLEKAVAIAQRQAGFPPKTLAETVHTMGVVLHAANRFDEAWRCYQQGLALRRKAWGEDHPVLAKSLGDLARLQADSKEPDADVAKTMGEAIGLLERWLDKHPQPTDAKADDDRIEALIDLGTLLVNVAWQELRGGAVGRAVQALGRGTDRLEQAGAEGVSAGRPLLENAADLASRLQSQASDPKDAAAAAALRERLEKMATPGSRQERRERAFWRGLRAFSRRMKAEGVDGRTLAQCLGKAIRGELPEPLRSVPELASLPSELARRAAAQPTFLVTSALALSTAEATGEVDKALQDLEELCVAGLYVTDQELAEATAARDQDEE
jgi:tetratricopeptide (TPR) repeat protein